MTTPAHTDFNPAKPDGTTTPTIYSGDDQTYQRALRDMIIAGLVPGFVLATAQGTGADVARAQFRTWYNSTLGIGFRWNTTWTGFMPTTVQEEWTNDSAVSWTAVNAPQVNTVDANNNITVSTVSGGWVTLFMEVWGKCLKVVSDFLAHQATTGTGVHGLGAVATWLVTGCAFTGGTLNGVDIGLTATAKLDVMRAREGIVASTGAQVSGVTIAPDVSAGSYFFYQPNAVTSATLIIGPPTNPPSGSKTQTITIALINARRDTSSTRITWDAAYHWITGVRPDDTLLELSGINLFVATWSGTQWDISHMGKQG